MSTEKVTCAQACLHAFSLCAGLWVRPTVSGSCSFDFHAMADCNLELRANINISSLKFLLLGYFITITENEINTGYNPVEKNPSVVHKHQ